jgi:hypothetical protein
MTINNLIRILDFKKQPYALIRDYQKSQPNGSECDLIYTPFNKQQSVSFYFDKVGDLVEYNMYAFPYRPGMLKYTEFITHPGSYFNCNTERYRLPREVYMNLNIKCLHIRPSMMTILDLISGYKNADLKPYIVVVQVPSGYIAYGEYNSPNWFARMDFDKHGIYQAGSICRDDVKNAINLCPYFELIPDKDYEFMSIEHILNTMLSIMEEEAHKGHY